MVRSWGALYILTCKCASRHNGVQFFISHLASWLRTRRFSEPTFRPSAAPNHWKNTVFRHFPTFSRICIFFLLTLSLLLFFLLIFLSSNSFSSTLLSSNLSLLSASSLLCFSSVHIVGSLTSKLPSIICYRSHFECNYVCDSCVGMDQHTNASSWVDPPTNRQTWSDVKHTKTYAVSKPVYNCVCKPQIGPLPSTSGHWQRPAVDQHHLLSASMKKMWKTAVLSSPVGQLRQLPKKAMNSYFFRILKETQGPHGTPLHLKSIKGDCHRFHLSATVTDGHRASIFRRWQSNAPSGGALCHRGHWWARCANWVFCVTRDVLTVSIFCPLIYHNLMTSCHSHLARENSKATSSCSSLPVGISYYYILFHHINAIIQ